MYQCRVYLAMDRLIYVDDEEGVVLFESLLSDVYAAAPYVARAHAAAFRHALDVQNPLRQFSTWKNILIVDGAKTRAHASVSIDTRRPHVAHVGYVESVVESEVVRVLFDHVNEVARGLGATHVRGPINFTTWQEFRSVNTAPGRETYFLEPMSSVSSSQWQQAGFVPQASYISTQQEAAMAPFKQRSVEGVTIERLATHTVDRAVRELHEVASDAFKGTWAFTPITLDEFRHVYAYPLSNLDTFTIFTARDREGIMQGFFVGAADMFDARHKTFVFKTIAVRAQSQQQGIGSALFSAVHEYAQEQRYESYIYSTMLVQNSSIQHMVGYGNTFRTYEVGERTL